jgi:orotate phosphoribosyltransferase
MELQFMKNVDDLIESAQELSSRGFSKGEIADELNVSRETANWLVERSQGEGTERTSSETGNLADIHVDWSALGRDSARLSYTGKSMADLLSKQGGDVDLTVGIEKAGTPIATVVARTLDTDIATYTPRKHQWEDGDIAEFDGTLSRNFANIRDRECYIVDDIITSGTTMSEAIRAIRERGGDPVACVVLVDKNGVSELEGVPVYSLIQTVRVGDS